MTPPKSRPKDAPRERAARKAPAAARRRVGLSTGWAAGILGLLVISFFHPLVFSGQTFVSPDATAPVGFVRLGEQSLYQDHVYPLWNPYVFLGMPSFASGAYNPLIYPPDWPLALLQKVLPLPDMTWMLLYYFLGGLFMFLLAREWGARPEGALLGGAMFAFVPNLVAVGSHGHGSQLVSSAYLPLLLWLASRWMRRGRLSDLGWLALAGGLQMLRGHVQIAFYSWLAVGVFVVVATIAGRGREPLRTALVRFGGIGLATLLAFGLAAFFNLPLRDYAQYSIRGGGSGGGVGMAYATGWSLGLNELATLVVPGALGFGGATYWGGMPFTDYPNAYVGIVTAVLMLPAFLTRGRAQAFALALAALAILVAFGKNSPVYGLLYDHLPLFNKFRVPVMILLLLHLAAALGIAWGWSRVLEEAESDRAKGGAVGRWMLGAALVLAVVFVAGVMGQEMWRAPYQRGVMAQKILTLTSQDGLRNLETVASVAFQGFITDLGRACLLGLLAVGVTFAARRRWAPVAVTTLAALALLCVDLWPIGGKLSLPVIGPRTERPLDAGYDDVIEFLAKAGPPGTFRVMPLTEFQSNRYAGFGIASVGGYHAAKPARIQNLIDRQVITNLWWSRLLNVRYFIADGHVQDPPPMWREVFNGTGVVIENVTALPRVTMLDKYIVSPGDSATIDSISTGATDPAEVTYLDRDPHLTLGPVDSARAEIVSYKLNDVVIETDSPGPALLRLADQWFPGWVASVDGRPVEVLRADYLLRAVPVPAGRHRVEFHYRPPAIRIGLWVSILSLVVILGLLLADRLRPRRAAVPVESG